MPNIKSATLVEEMNETKQFAIFTLFALTFYIVSDPVFAQSVIGSVLCSAYGLIYYDIGRGLATLAIVSLGVGAMLGRVTWGQAVTVCAGIGCVFGAITLTFALTPVSLIGAGHAALCGATGTLAEVQASFGRILDGIMR